MQKTWIGRYTFCRTLTVFFASHFSMGPQIKHVFLGLGLALTLTLALDRVVQGVD